MSPIPPEPTGFGPSEVLGTESPRRRLSRPLIVLGTAAAVLLGGVGVAAAAAMADSPSPTPSPSASAGTGSGSDSGPGKRWSHRLHGPHGAIRGEFVVPDGNGGYRTMTMQRGEVTAVDQDSITVKSADGHTREYAVTGETRVRGADGDGITAIKTGAEVHVTARVDGQTATAVSVIDLSGLRERWQRRDRDDDDDRPWGKLRRWRDHLPDLPERKGPPSPPSPDRDEDDDKPPFRGDAPSPAAPSAESTSASI